MPTFPFVATSPDGTKLTIVNELCRCGHFRTQHQGFEGPAALRGHGACATSACDCGQFTWKTQVFGGISESADKILSSIGPDLKSSGWYDELTEELESLEAEHFALTAEAAKLKDKLRKQEDVSFSEKRRRLELETQIGELAAKISKMTVPLAAINVGNRRILVDE
jgi:hypothetical protein